MDESMFDFGVQMDIIKLIQKMKVFHIVCFLEKVDIGQLDKNDFSVELTDHQGNTGLRATRPI